MKVLSLILFSIILLSCSDGIQTLNLPDKIEKHENVHLDTSGTIYIKQNDNKWIPLGFIVQPNFFLFKYYHWKSKIDTNRYQLSFYPYCSIIIPYAQLFGKSNNYIVKEKDKVKMIIRVCDQNALELINYFKSLFKNKPKDYQEVMQEIHGIGVLSPNQLVIFQKAKNFEKSDSIFYWSTIKTFNIKMLPRDLKEE